MLLSALACIRNFSPLSFSMAFAKSTQLTVHQERTFLFLHWTRQQSPVLDIHSSREIDQCASCAVPRHWMTSPLSVRISRVVFQGLVQVIRFQCRYGQVEIQFTCSFQVSKLSSHVSTLQVLVTQVYITSIVENIKSGLTPVIYCSFPTTALNNECRT